jgi:hypothetical protein
LVDIDHLQVAPLAEPGTAQFPRLQDGLVGTSGRAGNIQAQDVLDRGDPGCADRLEFAGGRICFQEMTVVNPSGTVTPGLRRE